MCGIFGFCSSNPVGCSKTVFFGLYAIQHRGQDSCGIASSSNGLNIKIHKNMGLVSQVFNETNINELKGNMAIGHVRYPTEGGSDISGCQPLQINTFHGQIAVVQNGQLVKYEELRDSLTQRGIGYFSSSDCETIMQILSINEPHLIGDIWIHKIKKLMDMARAAFSIILMAPNALYAFRDSYGYRPLCLGELNGDYMVSSESCSFETVGGKYLRELKPGEIITITPGYYETEIYKPEPKETFCIFEQVYFSRPDSILNNQYVHQVRQNIGHQLALEQPVKNADVVIGVPDSATPHAIGYAAELNIEYNEGFSKNRYIARTFIQPDDTTRNHMIKLKYNTLGCNLKDKIVVLVDDSIVRGNTIKPLINILRSAGAKEVHVRVASPPLKYPCYMGINMKTYEEMIANQMPIENIAEYVGANSLEYLSYEGLMNAVKKGAPDDNFCGSCFTGEYSDW